MMLATEIQYDCNKCNRFWLFKDYKQHTERKQCKPDPSAPNHIDKIKVPISASEQKMIEE